MPICMEVAPGVLMALEVISPLTRGMECPAGEEFLVLRGEPLSIPGEDPAMVCNPEQLSLLNGAGK